MKFLCIVLSLYVILLSVRPCCTDDSCTEKFSSSKDHPVKKTNADDCSSCSPFYRCGNCTGFAALVQVMPDIQITVSVHIANTAYRQPCIKDVSRAIWQPPRLI